MNRQTPAEQQPEGITEAQIDVYAEVMLLIGSNILLICVVILAIYDIYH